MKKILLPFALLFGFQGFSQTNPELNKFVGTWQWTSGYDTVTVVLEKQTSQFVNGDSREVLVGWHKYVKNGVPVESSIQHTGKSINADSIPLGNDPEITLYGFTKNSRQIWFNRFWDLSLHNNCHLFFELLPGSLTQASWTLTNPDGSTYQGPSGTYNQFTLPRNLTLTKQ